MATPKKIYMLRLILDSELEPRTKKKLKETPTRARTSKQKDKNNKK